MQLYLIRHGETDWNLEGRCQGVSDLALNETGHRQAEAIAARLATTPFQAIYSSPLQRAFDTARAIAAEHGLTVEPVSALQELDHGEFEGLQYPELARRYAPFLTCWLNEPALLKVPGGESLRELQERAWDALERIVERHQEGNVAVVAHNLCILTILCWAMNLHLNDFRRIQQDVAGISVIEFGGRRPHPVVLRLNDTSHLWL